MKSSSPSPSSPRSAPGGSGLARRDFGKLVGLAGVGAFFSRQPVMAGPFARADFHTLVPADKKLSADWIASLTARGAPEVLRGENLRWVGMPVGGLCTGQLYLGGDGRLWHWDIFNQHQGTGAGHYANPPAPTAPLEQGFAVRVGDQVRPLDRTGFPAVTFRGEYPIGRVQYQADGFPVEIALEAFSPYIPLNTDDSSLPATVLSFTVKNTSAAPVEAELGGWLQNAVCLHSGSTGGVARRNRVKRTPTRTTLLCTAEAPEGPVVAARPDIVFENFEQETYAGWTVEGTTFGAGPIEKAKIPEYQGEVGGEGRRVVNSHASGPGADVGSRDAGHGKLTSREFVIERHYITFFIGGGSHAGKTCLNLVVGGKVAQSATGREHNSMRRESLDVRKLAGQKARIEIVDAQEGGWGNIGVDHIVFSDVPAVSAPLAERSDYGSLALALLDPQPADAAQAALPGANLAAQLFPVAAGGEKGVVKPEGEKLVGALARKLALAPGASATVTFVLAWHFPNLALKGVPSRGRYYAAKFDSADAVADYLAAHFARLAAQTRLWRDTWYDASLPYWLLDRVHLNTSILASSTCFRFADGRFWAWEGVGCCAGTCGHVWQYAHSMARLFPDLERGLRERVDFGLALKDDGAIHFRGENNNIPAIDSQAGTILRALREHQASADDAFLKRIWPGVKKATDWLIAKDADGDGLIVGNQHNTLDTDWFGPVAWLSGLYVAALEAAAALADEVGEADYAKNCRAIAGQGRANLVSQLFDGEYFINKVDPAHLNAINSGTGCHIDQVMGQSWAFQVGLPRVFPEKESRSALQALWKYNFTPDVGPYRERYKPGRWYAMAGEAGLLMCSFPRSDWDFAQARGQGNADWAAGYFNECMNGFEYQVASHMVWEGLVQEGLAITRAVHDRYHASRRNPYNEVECGDHYARSMAVYGVYLAACGYTYHGPQGRLGFAPRLTPDAFRCAFTAAEGWGTFASADGQARLELKWGALTLRTLAVPATVAATVARVGERSVPCRFAREGDQQVATFATPLRLKAGETLTLAVR